MNDSESDYALCEFCDEDTRELCSTCGINVCSDHYSETLPGELECENCLESAGCMDCSNDSTIDLVKCGDCYRYVCRDHTTEFLYRKSLNGWVYFCQHCGTEDSFCFFCKEHSSRRPRLAMLEFHQKQLYAHGRCYQAFLLIQLIPKTNLDIARDIVSNFI
jgi:hypothetical protein